MKRKTIKNLGIISIDKLEVIGGTIEVFIPVEASSDELDAVLERCKARYKKDHPEIENVSFNVNLVFSMGYANPEFELQILVFDDDTAKPLRNMTAIVWATLSYQKTRKSRLKRLCGIS